MGDPFSAASATPSGFAASVSNCSGGRGDCGDDSVVVNATDANLP